MSEVLEKFEFQFHYGTIKRITRRLHILDLLRFNSTMVRLKVPSMPIEVDSLPRFNSTMVRLKDNGGMQDFTDVVGFNSTMVTASL